MHLYFRFLLKVSCKSWKWGKNWTFWNYNGHYYDLCTSVHDSIVYRYTTGFGFLYWHWYDYFSLQPLPIIISTNFFLEIRSLLKSFHLGQCSLAAIVISAVMGLVSIYDSQIVMKVWFILVFRIYFVWLICWIIGIFQQFDTIVGDLHLEQMYFFGVI